MIVLGVFRGNKNINVLNRSPTIHYLLNGTFSDFNFVFNGIIYLQYYLLTNDIYFQWFYFVQTIHKLQDAKFFFFAKMQEEVKKDVERCLGVLQSRFHIIQNLSGLWQMDIIYEIMLTCYSQYDN